MEKALSYEITHQRNLKRRNIKVVQETRHFDKLRNITVSIRSKEQAHDYRYYPEADLVPMRVSTWVPAIKASLPELPDTKKIGSGTVWYDRRPRQGVDIGYKSGQLL